MQYINIMSNVVHAYSDIFVRYLLGDENNKDLLLSFINAVNEDYDLPLLSSVTIKNPFNLKNFKNEKESIIDVKALDEHGRQYDIEVQITGNETFKYRSLYYWAKLYTSQLDESDKFQVLKPTICINMVNFTIIPETTNVHSCFLLMEKNNPDLVLTDHLIMHYLELPKFLKNNEFNTRFEKWVAYFKYEGKREELMNIIIKDDPVLSKAHERYTQFTQNDELLEAYEARTKWQLQYKSDLSHAEEQGILKGKIEGKAEGKIEAAKKMLDKGFDVEDISDITGLSLDEIKKLMS